MVCYYHILYLHVGLSYWYISLSYLHVDYWYVTYYWYIGIISIIGMSLIFTCRLLVHAYQYHHLHHSSGQIYMTAISISTY